MSKKRKRRTQTENGPNSSTYKEMETEVKLDNFQSMEKQNHLENEQDIFSETKLNDFKSMEKELKEENSPVEKKSSFEDMAFEEKVSIKEEEIEELPFDDNENQEVDMEMIDLLNKNEAYFRKSLDIDTERAQKGLTSLESRTFEKTKERDILSNVFEAKENDSEEKEDPEKELEEDPENEQIDLEEDLEEEEKEKDDKSKKKSKSRSSTTSIVQENQEAEVYSEEKGFDPVAEYYNNLGKPQEIEDLPDLDQFLKSAKADDLAEIQDYTEREKPDFARASHSKNTFESEEREWQEFLNHNVYDFDQQAYEEFFGSEEKPILEDVSDEIEETEHERQRAERFEKEFNQNQEDAQKDFENEQNEKTNEYNPVTAAAAAAAANAVANEKNVEAFERKKRGKDSQNGVGGGTRKNTSKSNSGSGTKNPLEESSGSGDSPNSKFEKETTNEALNDEQRDFENEQNEKEKDEIPFFNPKDEFKSSAQGDSGYRHYMDREDSPKANLFISYVGGNEIGKKIGKTALKEMEKLGRYGAMYIVSSAKDNHVAEGTLLMGRTVGTYVASPLINHLAKQAARLRTMQMLRRLRTAEKYAFMRDPKRMGAILAPYVQNKFGAKYVEGMENIYLNPTKLKHIFEMKKWLETDLREHGLPKSRSKLKKLLKKGNLSQRDQDLVKAYLTISKINKTAQRARIRPLKMLKNGYKKLKFTAKAQLRRSAAENEMHALNGAFLAHRYAKAAVKAVYRSFRTSAKIAKFMIPRAKKLKKRLSTKGNQRFTAGRAPKKGLKTPSKSFGGKASKVIKGIGKAGKAAMKGISNSQSASSSDPAAKAAAKVAAKAAKQAEKMAIRAAKVAAKMTVKATIYVVKLAIHIIGAIATACGPALLIALLCFMILASVENIFKLDDGTYYEAIEKTEQTKEQKIASEKKSMQQYADVVGSCRDTYKKNMKLIEEKFKDEFETINISYSDKKNNGVTKIYENSAKESNDIVSGDNTKEILAMASVFMNLNQEDYESDDKNNSWVLEKKNLNYMSEKDAEMLINVLVMNGLDPKLAEVTTYQKLIRGYMIGLYNGSHPASKRIEVRYCNGCERGDVLVDAEGLPMLDEDGNIMYDMYCPGHKHLYINVTTLYFDDIFACELKKKSDIVKIIEELGESTEPDVVIDGNDFPIGPPIDVSGSSTIEKLWNGLKSVGFTEEATAGIIGNLMWESGGYPNDVILNAVENNGKGEGIGMCQWSYGRKTNFLSFLSQPGRDINNVSDQLEFMLYELKHGQWSWPSGKNYNYSLDYKISLEEFKKCSDIQKATGAFCANFERCYTKNAHMSERIQGANSVYNTYHGKTTN